MYAHIIKGLEWLSLLIDKDGRRTEDRTFVLLNILKVCDKIKTTVNLKQA